MNVKVYGIARNTKDTSFGYKITDGKKYPIVKITHTKLNPEGMVTVIDDRGDLFRLTSCYFTFITE